MESNLTEEEEDGIEMFESHIIEEWDYDYIDSPGLMVLTDKNKKMNLLRHSREDDGLYKHPFFKPVLEDDEWSDANILDALIIPDGELIDSCGIIRLRKNGEWWGYCANEIDGPPQMFRIAPNLLEDYVILYVFPFQNWYARVVVRERGVCEPGMGIGYAICDTNGHVMFWYVFGYVLPQEQCNPKEARAMSLDWCIMLVRIGDRIIGADGTISTERIIGAEPALEKRHAAQIFRRIEVQMRDEINLVGWALRRHTYQEEDSDEWRAIDGFEYNPDSMFRLDSIHPRDADTVDLDFIDF